MAESQRYCRECGTGVSIRIPEGDNRERDVCDSCGFIQYDNPRNVVGCLLEWQGKVLLCRRAIEPRLGFWTLPAGFMENRETVLEGAAREAREEANAEAEDLRLFGIYNLPRISQVYLMFRGTLKDGFSSAGDETLEVGLFDESDIPWKDLAFPVVHEALMRYYESREQRHYRVHLADIVSRPGSPLDIVRHR